MNLNIPFEKKPFRKLNVLIACEFTGIIREQFTELGHSAMSCDLIETEIPGNHYKGDVRDIINNGWDLMIAHPPCTDLAVSGARWFKYKHTSQYNSLNFVLELWNAPIKHIAIENPISILSTRFKYPTQIIQPWMFGHGETKATCLWLKNLPKLQPTNIVPGRNQNILNMKIKDRAKNRSRTYPGIAKAIATQFSDYIINYF